MSRKWIWNPDTNEYKEWEGEMSHPEVADMLWRGRQGWNAIESGNWWGGQHYNNIPTEIYWFPMSIGSSWEAKQQAPLKLLQHFKKHVDNR